MYYLCWILRLRTYSAEVQFTVVESASRARCDRINPELYKRNFRIQCHKSNASDVFPLKVALRCNKGNSYVIALCTSLASDSMTFSFGFIDLWKEDVCLSTFRPPVTVLHVRPCAVHHWSCLYFTLGSSFCTKTRRDYFLSRFHFRPLCILLTTEHHQYK